MSSMKCWCCGKVVQPVPPRTLRKILNVVFWTSSLTMGMLVTPLLGLDVLLLPFSVAMGLSVGTTAREAGSWSCPSCHAAVHAPPEVVVPAGAPVTLRHA